MNRHSKRIKSHSIDSIASSIRMDIEFTCEKTGKWKGFGDGSAYKKAISDLRKNKKYCVQ